MLKIKDPCPQIPRTNENLKTRRNHLIRQRFYELYEVEDIRYDRVLEILAFDEFFLRERTIELIIKLKGKWINDAPFVPER